MENSKQDYLVSFREGWNTVYASSQKEAEEMAHAQYSKYGIISVKPISEKDYKLLLYMTD